MALRKDEASRLPMILGFVSLSLSPMILAYSLFFASNTDVWPSILGWLLTPVLNFTLYGVDFYLQHKASNGVNYGLHSSYTRILKYCAYGSLVFAIAHIVRIAWVWSVI